MAISPSLLKAVRLTHRYIGVFIAPAVLFFAFTGALQTFSLHETTRGSSYQPPHWIMVLSQIHKKQTPVVAKKKAAAPDPPRRADRADPAPAAPPDHNPLPLKLFFLLVAVGLFSSTGLGVYMSYKFSRDRAVVTALLAAGVLVPVAMVLL